MLLTTRLSVINKYNFELYHFLLWGETTLAHLESKQQCFQKCSSATVTTVPCEKYLQLYPLRSREIIGKKVIKSIITMACSNVGTPMEIALFPMTQGIVVKLPWCLPVA